MKAPIAGAALLALIAFTSGASACTCGVPGLESSLTGRGDRWGVRAVEGLAFGLGRWDAHGRYRGLPVNAHDRRYQLEALAALRPWARWELSAAASYVHTSTAAGDSGSSSSGPGDTFFRARHETVDEVAPHRGGIPWPSLALTGSLRVPTASQSISPGSGLGAYEVGAGPTFERSIEGRFRVSASGMVALRAPDHSLAARRQLGPRVTAQLAASYWPRPNLALSLASNLAWEGDVRYGGERQDGTGSRQWQVAAGVTFRPQGSNAQTGFRVRYTPPAPAVGVNVLGEVGFELSLAYTKS